MDLRENENMFINENENEMHVSEIVIEEDVIRSKENVCIQIENNKLEGNEVGSM
jgi:hypothetical protein